MTEVAYQLVLGDGMAWQITADEASHGLCERLAGIAGLKKAPAGGRPSLVLVGNGERQGLKYCLETCRSLTGIERLPESGWTCNRLRYVELWSHPGVPAVIGSVPRGGDYTREILQIQQLLYPVVTGAVFSGGLPLHSALVERGGQGVVIAAPGNTGKSTCCRRIPPPWRALGDDEALAVPDGSNGYRVHPFPTWSDYLIRRSEGTWDVQASVELAGVFFLKHSATDSVEPLGKGEAAAAIFNAGIEAIVKYERDLTPERRKVLRGRMLDSACRIAGTVPAYVLRASLTGQFWSGIEKVLDMS